MTQSKRGEHTPGPWQVVEQEGEFFITDKETPSNNIAIIEVDNAEANAHLIASAPELLEACKLAWTKASNHEKLSFEDCNIILEAISHAEGRA